MRTERIDIDEFARILRVGLGRALLHLRDHDPAPYREVIRHACLKNQMWDPQCEPMREQYLYELMRASGEFGYCRAHLLASLDDVSNGHDTAQRLVLARRLAQHGDHEARHRLYEAFHQYADSDWPHAAPEIVELDGLAGLLYVAERFDAGKLTAENEWILGSLVEATIEQAAEQQVRQALVLAGERDPRISRFLAAMDRFGWPHLEAPAFRHSAGIAAPVRYGDIRTQLQAGASEARALLGRWSRQTPPAVEVEAAARDLLGEHRVPILRWYLQAFWRCVFPLEPGPLLALVDHEDTSVSLHTTAALKHVRHPEVRRQAFDLLASGRGDGARMLAANFEDGDYALLERHLYSWRDRWQLHYLVSGVLDVCRENARAEAVGPLRAIYERAPCSIDREKAIEALIAFDALPEWMAAECRYDANPAIRELVGAQAGEG